MRFYLSIREGDKIGKRINSNQDKEGSLFFFFFYRPVIRQTTTNKTKKQSCCCCDDCYYDAIADCDSNLLERIAFILSVHTADFTHVRKTAPPPPA